MIKKLLQSDEIKLKELQILNFINEHKDEELTKIMLLLTEFYCYRTVKEKIKALIVRNKLKTYKKDGVIYIKVI